jgi:hypothetical protein
MPYGFTSPLAGTVEATLLTVPRFARKGDELALVVVVVATLAVAVVELEELVLLELPHPARARAMPARARIDDLGTGVFSCSSVSGTKQLAVTEGGIPLPSGFRRQSAHSFSSCATCLDSAAAGFLPIGCVLRATAHEGVGGRVRRE